MMKIYLSLLDFLKKIERTCLFAYLLANTLVSIIVYDI